MPNNIHLIVVGGFMVNYEPLKFLNQLPVEISYININLAASNIRLEGLTNIIHLQYKPYAKNIVIAYSMGGIPAVNYAQQYPKFLHRLILLNSTPKFIATKTHKGISQSKFDKLYSVFQTKSMDYAQKYFAKLAFYPARKSIGSCFSQIDRDRALNLLDIISKADLRISFNSLSLPVLMLYGEDDILVPVNKYSYLQQILPRQNHIDFSLNEQLILQLIRAFCHD